MRASCATNDTSPGVVGWSSNHPFCPKCKSLARPNVLMFGDYQWIGNRMESRRYKNWEDAVLGLLAKNPTWKLTILEVGCGLNVPSGFQKFSS